MPGEIEEGLNLIRASGRVGCDGSSFLNFLGTNPVYELYASPAFSTNAGSTLSSFTMRSRMLQTIRTSSFISHFNILKLLFPRLSKKDFLSVTTVV